MTQKKQKTIKVNIDTAQKLNYMARACGLSRPQFLKQLTDELFSICGEHKEIVLKYEARLDTKILNIMVCPKATYEIPLAGLSIAKKDDVKIPFEIKGEKEND